MKQKDIAVIIVIAVVAGAISLLVSRLIFVTPKTRQQSVEVAPVISTDFTLPSNKYFNINSIDPTQTIQIGANNNPAPFNSGQ